MKESDNILVKQWMTLEMTMHRYCYQNFKKLGPMGNPERGQGKLLCLIRNNPGIPQKELSEISNMRQQSVSELLKNGRYPARGIFSEKTGKSYDATITLTDDGTRSVYALDFGKEHAV